MRVPATTALSRLGVRLGERRQREEGGKSSLTAEDEANIASFEVVLSRTLDLLRAENDALDAGDIARVAEFYEEKTRLMKSLELRQPVVEPFLQERGESVSQLRGLISELASQLETNGRLLRGMAQASRTIIDEMARMRSRQSLEGVYDRSGQLRGSSGKSGKGITKKL